MAEEDGPAAGDDDDDDDGEIVNPMEKIQAFKSDPNAAYQKDPMRAIKEWYGRNDMEGPEFDVTEDKEGMSGLSVQPVGFHRTVPSDE